MRDHDLRSTKLDRQLAVRDTITGKLILGRRILSCGNLADDQRISVIGDNIDISSRPMDLNLIDVLKRGCLSFKNLIVAVSIRHIDGCAAGAKQSRKAKHTKHRYSLNQLFHGRSFLIDSTHNKR